MKALLYTYLSVSMVIAAVAVPSFDRAEILSTFGWVLLLLYICGFIYTVIGLLRYPPDDEARFFVVSSVILFLTIPLFDLSVVKSWKLLSDFSIYSGILIILLWTIRSRIENPFWEGDSADNISSKGKIAEFDTAEAAERAAWMLKGKCINETQVELPEFNASAQALDAVASTVGSSWSWVKSSR